MSTINELLAPNKMRGGQVDVIMRLAKRAGVIGPAFAGHDELGPYWDASVVSTWCEPVFPKLDEATERRLAALQTELSGSMLCERDVEQLAALAGRPAPAADRDMEGAPRWSVRALLQWLGEMN